MKNIFYIFLIITQALWSQTAFEKGNDLYQKGNYEQAIIAYQSILKTGKQSAEIYFNIGNCYYKQNKPAPAIYNFEKALLLSPNDDQIQNNLAFAQKMTIDDITPVPKVGFSKIIDDFTSTFNYDTWAWVSVILSILFFISFLGYYFSSTSVLKRIFFATMFFLLLFIVIGIVCSISEKNSNSTEKQAIVFEQIVSVKSEPKSSGAEVFKLHEGTKVYVTDSLNNYKKIQLLDLKEGWIEKNAIKEIR